MPIRIAASLIARLMGEAAADPAREICGLLFGDAGAITAARAAPNVAPDPERHFEIDPAVLFAALRAERRGGPRLIGHYHSHPNGRAEPSPRDLAAAEPGKLWLIIGGARARLWRAGADGFGAVEMIVNQDCA
jgi:proteasome lid subunit RPN8/RPN11